MIQLLSVDVRHEHRVRLVFSNALAAGAFGAPAPAAYTITNIDGRASSPTVQAAFIVPGMANVVELALAYPLAKGVLYTVSATGVPAVDATTTDTSATAPIRWGLVSAKENVEPIQQEREKLLYFTDLIWNGFDIQETTTGDLERVSGTANVDKALNRVVEASGLPWDPAYGARAKEDVDSPSTSSSTLKGRLSEQLLRDPRVDSVKVTHEIDEDKTYLYADPVLISGEAVERIITSVPNE